MIGGLARAGDAAAPPTPAVVKSSPAQNKARLYEDYGVYDVSTLVRSGNSAERLDIAIVSSGFARQQSVLVRSAAGKIIKALLAADPFRSYAEYINFHLVAVDDPGGCEKARVSASVENGKMLTCDYDKAEEYGELAPADDLVIVLCNVKQARSAAFGRIVTLENGLDMGQTFVHEVGHAFAGLADEYADEQRQIPLEKAKGYVNVGFEPDPRRSAWHYWVPKVWKGPYQMNTLPSGHKVENPEGGFTHPDGIWRPEKHCLMACDAEELCVVCREEVEKHFFRFIAPVSQASPGSPVLRAGNREALVFKAEAIEVKTFGGSFGKFTALWTLDGAPRTADRAAGRATSMRIRGGELAPGTHEVGLSVVFSDSHVRRDHGWLASSLGWRVEVLPGESTPAAANSDGGEGFAQLGDERRQIRVGHRRVARIAGADRFPGPEQRTAAPRDHEEIPARRGASAEGHLTRVTPGHQVHRLQHRYPRRRIDRLQQSVHTRARRVHGDARADGELARAQQVAGHHTTHAATIRDERGGFHVIGQDGALL